MMRLSLIPLFTTVLLLSWCSAASAYPKTDAEFAKLPPYCKARWTEKHSATYARGKQVFGGRNWAHMHHYCAGLNAANHGKMARDKKARTRAYRGAIEQFQYMEKNTEPSWFMRAEISTQKAKAALELGDYSLAFNAFTTAIQLKPDYVPAYSGLGEVYVAQGDFAKAREIYEAGLQQKPESKLLKRKLKELTKQKSVAQKNAKESEQKDSDANEAPKAADAEVSTN